MKKLLELFINWFIFRPLDFLNCELCISMRNILFNPCRAAVTTDPRNMIIYIYIFFSFVSHITSMTTWPQGRFMASLYKFIFTILTFLRICFTTPYQALNCGAEHWTLNMVHFQFCYEVFRFGRTYLLLKIYLQSNYHAL